MASKRLRSMLGGYERSEVEELPEEEADTSPARPAWEKFDAGINVRDLPIVVFTDEVTEQRVWYDGCVRGGQVHVPDSRPDVVAEDPVVMSPAYLGFAIEPYELRYLHYRKVGILFARPRGGKFMQPSIDTILVARALVAFFAKVAKENFTSVLDVGSGSGFIGKFAAAYAPGSGPLKVTLVDIDETALQYCRSPHFHGVTGNFAGRSLDWHYHAGDAVEFLKENDAFDLIVSNPPYIPTVEETRDSARESLDGNFWEGCGLVVHLLELMLQAPIGTHLVLAFSSMTLKSLRVRELLSQAPERNLSVEILLEREVAWKAWYAGRGSWGGGSRHILASASEAGARERIGRCDFFVGATEPGHARGRRAGSRHHFDYHWHMSYVVHVCRTDSGGT